MLRTDNVANFYEMSRFDDQFAKKERFFDFFKCYDFIG